MKYIKTYEQFSYSEENVNEGLLNDSLYDILKNFKDKKEPFDERKIGKKIVDASIQADQFIDTLKKYDISDSTINYFKDNLDAHEKLSLITIDPEILKDLYDNFDDITKNDGIFKKPGKTKINNTVAFKLKKYGTFQLTKEVIEWIKTEYEKYLEENPKYHPKIVFEDGELCVKGMNTKSKFGHTLRPY